MVTQLEDEKICKLYESGLKLSAVAKRAKLSVYKVRRILDEAGIMRRQGARQGDRNALKNDTEMVFLGVQISREAEKALLSDPRGKSAAVREAIELWRDKHGRN